MTPTGTLLEHLHYEPYLNSSGQTVPPWGLMVVTTTTKVAAGVRLTCERPGTTFYRTLAINGRYSVANGKKGDCTRSSPVPFAYDTGTPVHGESFGAKPSQFTASKGFPAVLTVNAILDSATKIAFGTFAPNIVTMLAKSVTALAANTSYSTTTNYKIYTGTAGSEADSGFTTLPTIFVRNAIPAATFFDLHWIDNAWYAGQGGSGGGRIFKALLNGALAKADANATIDTVTALDAGAAPSPTSAANYLRWAGANNDPCFIIEDTSSGTAAYSLLSVVWDIVQPVTTVDVSGTALRQTTRDGIGKWNAAANSPSTIDAGTTC